MIKPDFVCAIRHRKRPDLPVPHKLVERPVGVVPGRAEPVRAPGAGAQDGRSIGGDMVRWRTLRRYLLLGVRGAVDGCFARGGMRTSRFAFGAFGGWRDHGDVVEVLRDPPRRVRLCSVCGADITRRALSCTECRPCVVKRIGQRRGGNGQWASSS